jgi:pyrroloquinoline quinone biosynthesis protein B
MESFLKNNGPWSQLTELKNIELQPLSDEKAVALTESLSVTPFLVPHRDEFTETVGFRIDTGEKSLIYIPDIDKWSKWKKDLRNIVRENDLLLLDGTFYADGEIPRPMSEVPHPFVSETMALLDSLSTSDKQKVFFIHLNHSNPLIQGDKKTLKYMKNKGFGVAYEGLRLEL